MAGMRCLNCNTGGLTWSVHSCPHCGVSMRALMSDMLVPRTTLRRTYEIDFPIGRGGFGITYQARHLTLGHVVAIKEFYPRDHANRQGVEMNVAATSDQADVFARNLQRFIEQGRSLAQLAHPNVIRVFDLFVERGTAYLVMELVEGGTLRGLLNQKRTLPFEQVESVTQQLVSALEAVHERRIFHLDIKPENILLTPDGRAVLVDFGAARQGFSRLSTQAYTVQYAAPEVVAGDDVGPDSDLFELGMIVHEMLTGQRPPCALERMLKKDDWTPHDLPADWHALVHSAVRLKRSERPPTLTAWWESRASSGRAPFAAPASAPAGARDSGSAPVEEAGLAGAVAEAAEGEVLRLAAGCYRLSAPLVVSRGIGLCGAADGTTVIEYAGEGTAVRFEGRGPWHIRDLTFVRTHDSDGHAVEVRGGEIAVERCRFTGGRGTVGNRDGAGLCLLGRTRGSVRDCDATGSVVGIGVGDKTSVSVEESRASDNARAGVCFDGYAEGTARGIDAARNRDSGLWVSGDAKPVLEANRCTANGRAGIAYTDHGGGKAWYNECSANGQHGILVADEGGPVLDSNHCSNNGRAGIAFSGKGGGNARANECAENGEYGILAFEDAGPALEENCCQSNRRHGIVYLDQAAGNCRANQLLFNASHGLSLSDSCMVAAVENVAVGNGGCGIAFSGRSGGVVKSNRIRESGESGISLSDQASPQIEANEITHNAMAGLLVRGDSQVRAVRNQLVSNLYGAYVDERAHPIIESSSLTDNSASGLAFFGSAGGTARENGVEGNTHGIYLDDHAAPLLENNRCCGNRDSGIVWFGSAGGTARDNEAAANDVYGFCVSDEASPEITGNRCHRNKGSGLYIQGQSRARVAQNAFVQNVRNGLEVRGHAVPVVEGNTAQENAGAGMVFGGDATGEVSGNACLNNAGSGIEVRDGARPHLVRNRAAHNGAHGIAFLGQAGGVVASNKVSRNARHGITLIDRAHPRIEDNECEANQESGLAWFGDSAGVARGNRANMNEVHGILVCERARPQLEGNACVANLALDVMVPAARSISQENSAQPV